MKSLMDLTQFPCLIKVVFDLSDPEIERMRIMDLNSFDVQSIVKDKILHGFAAEIEKKIIITKEVSPLGNKFQSELFVFTREEFKQLLAEYSAFIKEENGGN